MCVHVSVLLARTAACPLSSHPTFCAFSCRGNGEAECGSQAAQGLQHWLYWLHKGRDCRPPRTASGGGRFKQPHDITLLSQIDPQGPFLLLPSLLPIAVIIFYFCKLIAFYILGGGGKGRGGNTFSFGLFVRLPSIQVSQTLIKQQQQRTNLEPSLQEVTEELPYCTCIVNLIHT